VQARERRAMERLLAGTADPFEFDASERRKKQGAIPG
jgi:hypothetical protein